MNGRLSEQLAEARAHLARLEQSARSATCQQLGAHDWKLLGGKNAGCGRHACGCSVHVYECTRCGDCDYGDNAEAAEIIAECRAQTADESEPSEEREVPA